MKHTMKKIFSNAFLTGMGEGLSLYPNQYYNRASSATKNFRDDRANLTNDMSAVFGDMRVTLEKNTDKYAKKQAI